MCYVSIDCSYRIPLTGSCSYAVAIDADLLQIGAIAANWTMLTSASSTSTLQFNIAERDPHKRQGKILRMARIAQSRTLEEVGEAVNVDREEVRLWETGKRKIDPTVLLKLAEYLAHDVSVFWG